jgi:hypothetical protein
MLGLAPRRSELDLEITDAWHWVQKAPARCRRNGFPPLIGYGEVMHLQRCITGGWISRLKTLRKAARPKRECPMRRQFLHW